MEECFHGCSFDFQSIVNPVGAGNPVRVFPVLFKLLDLFIGHRLSVNAADFANPFNFFHCTRIARDRTKFMLIIFNGSDSD